MNQNTLGLRANRNTPKYIRFSIKRPEITYSVRTPSVKVTGHGAVSHSPRQHTPAQKVSMALAPARPLPQAPNATSPPCESASQPLLLRNHWHRVNGIEQQPLQQ